MSPVVVKVKENEVPGPVKCEGKGHPKLSYEWRKNLTAPVKGANEDLQREKLTREDSGSYVCIAFNKHPPNKTAEVFFDVLCKLSECSIIISHLYNSKIVWWGCLMEVSGW